MLDYCRGAGGYSYVNLGAVQTGVCASCLGAVQTGVCASCWVLDARGVKFGGRYLCGVVIGSRLLSKVDI